MVVADNAQPDDRTTSARQVPTARGSWSPDDAAGHQGHANGQQWVPAEAVSAAAERDPVTLEPDRVAPEPERRPIPTATESVRTPPFEPEPDLSTTATSRRGRAVEVCCAELCLRGNASAAAAEILGSFEGGDDHDLLRVMRVLAAKHAIVDPEERHGWRRVLSAEGQRECTSTPFLLAAGANGDLGDTEGSKLEDHLNSCITCQTLELRSQRAERMFAAITGLPAIVVAGDTAADETAPGNEVPRVDLLAPAAPPESEIQPEPKAEPKPPAQPEPSAQPEVQPESRPAAEPGSEGSWIHDPEPETAIANAAWLPAEFAAAESRRRREVAPEAETPPAAAAATGAEGGPTPAPATEAEVWSASAAAIEAGPAPAVVAEAGAVFRRRRRLTLTLAGVGAALLAGVALAAALAAGTSSKHHTLSTGAAVTSQFTTPRVASTRARKPTRHVAARPARRRHPTTPSATPAANAPAAAATSAPATPTPRASSPPSQQSAPSSSPAPQSSPAPSPSSSSSTPTPSSPAPSPTTSIHQPSLGTTSAPQGIGNK